MAGAGEVNARHTPSESRPLKRPSATLFLLSSWVMLVVAGLVLAFAAHVARPFPGELVLTRELQEPRAVAVLLTPLMSAVSAFGYFPWAELVFVLVLGGLLVQRCWSASLLVALTTTGDLLAGGIKLLVARPRPSADLVDVYRRVSGYSFPSGHVVHYVVFFGVIVYLTWRALRSERAHGAWRRAGLLAMLATSVGLILLVGTSRVYLGAHWPTDVLGGYLIGGAWLMLLVAVYRRWLAPTRPAV